MLPKNPMTSLSAALDKKLLAYAVAISAAGVGTLATPPSAEGKIVYTPMNETLVFGKTTLDINNDGNADFLFESAGLGHIFSMFVRPRSSNFVVVYSAWAAALPTGVTVGPPLKSRFTHRPRVMEFESVALSSGTNYFGLWANTQNMYLGLEITISGKHHYGWARISMPKGAAATITGHAYETVPGKAIVTGATSDKAEVSEAIRPADLSVLKGNPSLGFLARGAAALDVWRREEGGI